MSHVSEEAWPLFMSVLLKEAWPLSLPGSVKEDMDSVSIGPRIKAVASVCVSVSGKIGVAFV